MKIFHINTPFDKKTERFEFRMLQPKSAEDYVLNFKTHLSHNEMIDVEWVDNSFPVGDFIGFIGGVILSEEALKKLTIKNTVIEFCLDNMKYFFVKPNDRCDVFKNRDLSRLPLVTESFKNAWESNNLTGAEFEYVGDLPDEQFIQIDK